MNTTPMDTIQVAVAAPVEEKTILAEEASESGNSFDAEKRGELPPMNLKRKLKARHLQMIAIGGTIGTGLFIGSGGAIAKSGPAGALIAYMFVGTIVYSVMNSLGEMATYVPVTGAFTAYAKRFIDPSLGFAMGWVYWFSWAMTYSLELTATGLIIQYWAPNLNIGIFIGCFWAVITALNFLPVSFYGEFEFWLSSIKVLTVLGFLIFAICIDAGAGQNGHLGFYTWSNPGAFAPYLISASEHPGLSKFVGFWAVLIQAGFAYQGTELVGIAAGETENPRKNVPAAIKKTFYRILFFFVLTIFFIGLLVPYTNEDLLSSSTNATASPFVIAAVLAGVKVLPGLINAVLLFVVLSAANSNLYSGSRILLGLAQEGSAPKILAQTNTHGVPYIAVAFTSLFGILAFLNESTNGGTVFNWLLNITAVAGFITWACINGCHIAFIRALSARHIARDTLPFKALGGKYFAWYGLGFNILIIMTQGFTAFIPWNTQNFFIAYVSVILFVVMYLSHKIVTRSNFVSSLEADIVTGALGEVEKEETWSLDAPSTAWGKFWAWVA